MIITLKVEGMSCQHCVDTVKKAVEKTTGVKSAQINLKEKTVVVEHDESADIHEIKNAIEDEGFSIIV